MNKELAAFFLKIGNESFIIPILALGYIWLKRKQFYHAICITLFAIIYARALKNYFQIYSLKYGLIFPSGHTVTETACYGWIALKSKKIFIWFVAVLFIFLSTYSMIIFEYHTLNHILGGIFFAVILIIIYNYLLIIHPKLLKISLIPVSIILLIYIYYKKDISMNFMWTSIYALIGVFVGENIFHKRERALTKKAKFFATCFYFLINLIVTYSFSCLNLSSFLLEIRWFILGITLPFSVYFAHFIVVRRKQVEYF